MAERHTLIVIGWLGSKRAYLDLSLEEAQARYRRDEGEEPAHLPATIFEFGDEFACYDAWASAS
jgi:hypothetical protein